MNCNLQPAFSLTLVSRVRDDPGRGGRPPAGGGEGGDGGLVERAALQPLHQVLLGAAAL